MMYLGDFAEDSTVHFLWSTNAASGASITRATDGTVSVYKDNGATQSTAGITDTEDFDTLTGIHACTIDLSADAFYAVGSNYSVVLSAATIDGQTVNAVLAHFSIENRDGILQKTYAEPAQGAPGATTSMAEKIGYLYKAWRNRTTQTATTYSLYNDDATTVDHKATVSDDATTFDKGEVATGP